MTVHDEHHPVAKGAAERLRQSAPSSELAADAEQRPEAAAGGEARFLTLLRSTRYGYAELDAGGNIREVNQRASVILGCPAGEAIGIPFADFVHETDREVVRAGFERVLRHAEEPPLECRIGVLGQGFQTVSLFAGLFNAGAAHPRVVYLIDDVTDIRDTEAALRASETQLRSLLEHVPDIVLVVSPEDRIEHINRTFWGLRASQLTGTQLIEHFAPEDHQTARRSLETVRSTGQPQHFEVQGVDGRWLMCRAVALQDGGAAHRVMLICSDVTQRKEGEESLRRSENELRCLFDNIPDFVILVDKDAHIQFVNRPVPGATVQQLLGATDFSFIDPEYHVACRRALGLAFASGRPQELEMRDVFGVWWDCRLVPMPREDRSPGEVMIICANVTARKQTEISLRESEQRYRLITENSFDLIWVAYLDGLQAIGDEPDVGADRLLQNWQWTFISSSVQRVVEYTVEEALRLPVSQWLTPTSYTLARNTVVQFLSHSRDGLGASVRPINVELEHVAKSGRSVWCEVTIRASWEQDGNRLHLEGVTRDITQRKNFERTLASMIDQRQQQMVQQLHDELGQNLLGVRLMAEGLKKSLLARDAVEVPNARELAQAAERAQHCVRQIIKGVRPVEVASSGLMAALADLALHTQRLAGLSCTFECDQDVPVDNSHTATELFYIAQEAVRNAVKHASPHQISIGLSADVHQLSLTVADDGQGIEREWDDASGMGLRIMKHRAAVINASLIVKAAEPRGTLVVCTLPLGSRTRQ